jgi:hypothetical protein
LPLGLGLPLAVAPRADGWKPDAARDKRAGGEAAPRRFTYHESQNFSFRGIDQSIGR